MNNEFEKSGTPPPAEKQEQAPVSEQAEASQEISEVELQRNIEQATGEVDGSQNEVIASADKRIENVPASASLSQEKGAGIYEQGGFANRIKNIKEKIVALAQSTKERIKNLVSREAPESSTIEGLENEPQIKDFSDLLKHRDEIVSELSPEQKIEVADTVAEMGAIADTAREMTNESHGVETVGPEIQEPNGEQVISRSLAENESILEKENPFEYMAAVRVSNNLPVFENGKLLLKTAMDVTKGKVPRPTLHFTVNCRVGNNDGGNWDDVGYAYIMPMDKMVEANGKPYAFGKDDTFYATATGVEMPSTSKIIFRADKKDDPAFKDLQEQCRQNNIPIEFVEVQANDDTVVERLLEKDGYGNYINRNQDKNEIDIGLAKKMEMVVGGYGNHTGSPIWQLEKAFLSGQPGYEFTDEEKDSQWKNFIARNTPFGQIRVLLEVAPKIPEDVRQKFEELGLNNLNILLNDKARFEQYAQIHAEAETKFNGSKTASEFKTEFYAQGVDFLSKHKDAEEFLSKNPDVQKRLQDVLVEVADSPEMRIIMMEIMQGEKIVPPELQQQLVEKNIDRGGFTAFQIAEYFEGKLTPEQQQRIKESIAKNADSLTETATQDVIERTVPDIIERRDYFEKKYGKAFVEKFEQYLKK